MRRQTPSLTLTVLACSATLLTSPVLAKEEPKECVCFELTGEFGEEIRAILSKYAKNLGEKEIRILPEQSAPPPEQSFLESLTGFASGLGGNWAGQSSGGYDLNRAREIYANGCASCHGESGGELQGSMTQPLHAYNSQSLKESLEGFKNGSYVGPSRFVKNTLAKGLTGEDIGGLVEVILGFAPAQ